MVELHHPRMYGAYPPLSSSAPVGGFLASSSPLLAVSSPPLPWSVANFSLTLLLPATVKAALAANSSLKRLLDDLVRNLLGQKIGESAGADAGGGGEQLYEWMVVVVVVVAAAAVAAADDDDAVAAAAAVADDDEEARPWLPEAATPDGA